MIDWRKIQRDNFTNWKHLAEFIELEEHHFSHILSKSCFPLNLPKRIAEKIQKKTFNDPILQQFLPLKKEEIITPGFKEDPVDDATFRSSKKYLKKYEGRALLLASGACAMHCRYCFRRNFDYARVEKGFEEEIQMIKNDTSLREIILSGGDPLSLSNATLADLIQQLGEIPHLKRLRFHTRFPIGIPERIDTEFLSILAGTRLQTYFILQCNHVKELDAAILSAMKKIQKLGIPVMTHTVLLKGINDTVEVLKELCETLVDHGILPYYLNQLDKLQGSAHFEVQESEGLFLMEELRKHLSGYAIPRYIKEIPGHTSKTPIVI